MIYFSHYIWTFNSFLLLERKTIVLCTNFQYYQCILRNILLFLIKKLFYWFKQSTADILNSRETSVTLWKENIKSMPQNESLFALQSSMSLWTTSVMICNLDAVMTGVCRWKLNWQPWFLLQGNSHLHKHYLLQPRKRWAFWDLCFTDGLCSCLPLRLIDMIKMLHVLFSFELKKETAFLLG